MSDKYLNFKDRETNSYISEWKYYWGKARFGSDILLKVPESNGTFI